MTARLTYMLWPRRADYDAFVAACDDDVPPSFDEFANAAWPAIEEAADRGVRTVKVSFLPGMMKSWCKKNRGAVDARARMHYAAFLASQADVVD